MGRLVPMALILLTLPASAARAAQWFVAPGGSDAGPGTSAQPFATVQRGVDAAVAGDTVTVRAGVYLYTGPQDGMAVTLSKAGSPASGRVTIAAETPGAAVLDGGGLAHSYFNLTSSAAFVTIRGFEIRNTRWSGVWANGTAAKDVVVQGNAVHDIGFRLETSSFGIAGIFTNAAASAWTIDGNTIYAIGRSSGNMTGALDHGLYVAGGSFTVRSNVFSQLRNGWHIQLADGFSGKIANNTFFGPDPVASQPGQLVLWNRSGNLEIKNNLFYGPRANAIHTVTASVSGVCQLQNNLAFSTAGAVGLIAAAPPGCVQSGNLLNADPQPAAPAPDPRLADASPAKDAGLSLSYVPADYFGTARPQGPAFDIGAYEAVYSTAALFTTQVPAANASSPGAGSIELGVRLKADLNGLITAIRFYKVSANATGPHTAHLWSSGGALLGTASFSAETASGWQTAAFAKPIPVYSTATYVASYHTPGGYPVARNYFVSQFNHAPLHAPADTASAHDGGYQYGTAAVFPNQGVSASNYWVDAVFSYSTGPVVSSTTLNPVPTITSFSPSSGTAGSPAFSLQVFGSGFVAGSTGQWNGAPRATAFVSASQLSLAVSTADLAAAATDFVGVVSPGPGGGASAALPFLVGNPAPVASSLSPSSATAGGPGFTLTVLGSGFVSTSTVLWNGAARPTTFVGKTALQIALSPADLSAAGTNQAAVFTAQPGGGRSASLAFTVAASSGPPPPPPPPPSGSTATLFGTLAPASNQWSGDAQSVELGVRFRTDYAGQVTALRFYKQPNMTGAHTGHLWSSTGALLGSVSFTGETASGWQTAALSSPVAISSGAVYLASFHAAGGYAATRSYFAAAGVDNGPLHAPQDAAGAPDGAYIYSAAPAMPAQGYQSTNYWADAVVSYSTAPAAPSNPAPAIAALSPSSATAGDPGFSLQVLGSGFVSTSTVLWNGAARPTLFVSSTALSIAVSSADLAAARTSSVTVFNAAPGGGLSAAGIFVVAAQSSPAPILLAVDPSTAAAGGPGFQLRALGSGFVSTSTVLWNGAARATSFVDSGTLTVLLSSADAAAAGSARVEVFTAPPGGGLSSSATVSFLNPPPSIAALSPSSGVLGSSLTLTVSGAGFVSTTTVLWNGAARAALSRSSAAVSVALSTADLAAVGTATVTVFNAAPGGGLSDPAPFEVVNPAPALLSLSPSSATAAGPGFTLTLLGAGFVSSSSVLLNGQARDTLFLSSAALSVSLSSGDVASTGTLSAAVFTPAPGGGLSAPRSLTLGWPSPSIAALSPSSATAGDAGFTLQVLGAGFVSTSTVLWNGAPLPAVLADTGTLLVDLSSADLAAGGVFRAAVFNPAPGGGLSAPGTFTVLNPAPALLSLSQSSATAGDAAFALQVFGAGFVSTSTVLWNGRARPTAFVDTGTLTAQVAAADLSSGAVASVSVFTALPGGGLSSSGTFTVYNATPAIAALIPASASQGGPGFSLKVLGSGFAPGSTALWNGSARATAFLSSASLSVAVAPADLASPGTASVAVLNGPPGGGLSDPAAFTVSSAAAVSTGPWTAAYYTGWLATQLPIGQVDLGAVDAIIHFSVQPNSDGSLNRASNSLSTAAVTAVVTTVHGAGKKVLFSCGGWQTEAAFASAMSSTHQATFLASLVNFMTTGGYDGIDLDMEPIAASEVPSYVAFVKALRARLDQVQPGSLITAAVDWQPQAFAQLTHEIDHINLLSYSLSGPYLGQTWHESPVFSPSSTSTLRSLDSMVRTYLAAGLPAEKLGGGVSFDAYDWTGGSGVTGPQQKWTSSPSATEVVYSTIADHYGLSESSPAAHPLYRWDAAAMSPYLSVPGTPASASRFISFNDASIIYEKYRYARAKGLGAMIIWDIQAAYRPALPPGQRDGLWQAVKAGRFNPPPLNPAPVLSSIDPPGAAPGSGAFTLTASGSGFTPGSVVRWKGSARPTQFVDAGTLTAQIAAADVSSAGTAAVTVFTPAPAGGESASAAFQVAAPAGFAALSLNPSPTVAEVSLARTSGAAIDLGVTGGGFVEPSLVCWNGAPLPTTFVSGEALVGKLSSGAAADGRGVVTVKSPEPGGGVSNASTVTAAGLLGCPPAPPRRQDPVAVLSRGVFVFSPVAQDSVVEIFTPQGRLLRSVPGARGQAVWDLTDAAGRRVAPGRYLYTAVAPDGRRGGGTVTVPLKL